jgi:hypothetical protein
MGGFLVHFFSWGVALQILCFIHFFRRRPDQFWLFVIFFGGALGAAVYMVMEVLPDLTTLRASVNRFSRKRRIHALEALVQVNPAIGNREELADLLLEEGQYARARAIYNEIISPRTEEIDVFYRRGLCAMAMDDPAAAIPDLERAVTQDHKYDFYRAPGMLAQAYALTGQPDRAEKYFRDATEISTLSETMYNYAAFLFGQGRDEDARAWAKKVADKELTLPRYLRRRERPWTKRAKALLKK